MTIAKRPLVTISIPTLQSAGFLETCLKAIFSQTYKHIEVNIVDGGSTDGTVEIAKKYRVKVIPYPKALLGARYEGMKDARGEYILFLDSDQVLSPNAIKEGVAILQSGDDMLILEEGVYRPKTWIEKLFVADRKLVHVVKDFSPETGVMLPRMYKKKLLQDVFSKIPKSILENVGGQDHAIIYFEAWKKSKKVGYIKDAVKHIEPQSLRRIWKKFYRWGYTSIDARYGKYDEMLTKKEHFRTGLFQKGLVYESFASILLLLLKGIPYKIGYYRGKYHL